MSQSSYTAATGLIASQKSLAVASNNLANAKTDAFKKQDAVFTDLVYRDEGRIGDTDKEAGTMQFGTGATVSNVVGDFRAGPLKATENKMHIALDGDKGSFIPVMSPEGDIFYTRDGMMSLNKNGELIHAASGYTIGEQVLQIPAGQISNLNIAENGRVTVLDETNQEQEIGFIELASFINPPGLQRLGKNLYKEVAASGGVIMGLPGEDGFERIMQGFIEESNVNSVIEILNIVDIQKLNDYNTRAFKTSSEIERKLYE